MVVPATVLEVMKEKPNEDFRLRLGEGSFWDCEDDGKIERVTLRGSTISGRPLGPFACRLLLSFGRLTPLNDGGVVLESYSLT